MRFSYKTLQFFFSTLIISGLLYGYLYLPLSYQNIDDRLRDFMFLIRGEKPASSEVIIVDIDEKSLQQIGQWPWDRRTVSRMIQNLSDAKAGIIGLDIVFSEEDKTSPHRFGKNYQINQPFPNYDSELAETIKNTPTILGYVFNFDPDVHNKHATIPQIPAVFIEKNFQNEDFLITPNDILSNIPIIQTNAYSSGFINNVPDAAGIIRSVPLVMRYQETIFPSLGLELFRIASDAQQVTLEYSPTGIASIHLGELSIPTDRNGRLYLNHRGPGKTFHYISASDIVSGHFDPNQIEGKFILVGTSAYGLMDLRSNPFDNIIPGIEIHATVIDNMLNGDMLIRPDWIELIEITMIISLTWIVFYLLARLKPLTFIFIFSSGFFLLLYLNYYLLFVHHLILNLFFMILALTLSMFSILGMNFFFEHRQKEQVKKKFAQKVSAQVMDDLLTNEQSEILSTREVEVTIFFSDIRSFTTISETLGSPHKLVAFLNEYMTVMAEPIIQTHGTIDKFIGDAIMAYWNAPNQIQNHADMAVQSALSQLALRETLSQRLKTGFGVDLDFGIGLNTGIVTVGDIGSQGRSDYTIIGDPVNLASRLEGLCKYYHVHLIISENTLSQLTEFYIIRELDQVRVKGKHESIRIFEVLGNGTPSHSLQEELESFRYGLHEYYAGRFDIAIAIFEELFQRYSHPLYSLYRERCTHLQTLNLERFDGIYEFHEK